LEWEKYGDRSLFFGADWAAVFGAIFGAANFKV
jgi:hypothetical protein